MSNKERAALQRAVREWDQRLHEHEATYGPVVEGDWLSPLRAVQQYLLGSIWLGAQVKAGVPLAEKSPSGTDMAVSLEETAAHYDELVRAEEGLATLIRIMERQNQERDRGAPRSPEQEKLDAYLAPLLFERRERLSRELRQAIWAALGERVNRGLEAALGQKGGAVVSEAEREITVEQMVEEIEFCAGILEHWVQAGPETAHAILEGTNSGGRRLLEKLRRAFEAAWAALNTDDELSLIWEAERHRAGERGAEEEKQG